MLKITSARRSGATVTKFRLDLFPGFSLDMFSLNFINFVSIIYSSLLMSISKIVYINKPTSIRFRLANDSKQKLVNIYSINHYELFFFFFFLLNI